MGSPQGPVQAKIFMVKLEARVISNLNNKLKLWKSFVNDTYCLARSEYIDNILLALTSYHKNIKLAIEIEKDNAILFLEISIIKKAQEKLKLHCIGKRFAYELVIFCT